MRKPCSKNQGRNSVSRSHAYIPLKKAAEILAKKKKPYSRGYLTYLARNKKLRAKKIGRDWMTTKNWLSQFVVNQNAKCKNQNNKLKCKKPKK